jgi:quercetin dioxygenase-like cupin family protein
MSEHTTRNYITETCFVKEFLVKGTDTEYNYHKDPTSRIMKVLEGEGWCIKFKNREAKQIRPGSVIHISKQVIHKLIKGTSKLKVQVLEL